MCFQLANAPSCCAPTEREPNSVMAGYKHVAPLGRKSDSFNSFHFKLEFAFTINSLLRRG